LPLLPFEIPAHTLLFCKVMSEAVTFDQYIPDDEIATWINQNESTDEMDAFNERYADMDYGAIDFYDIMGDMLYYEWIFLFASIFVLMLNRSIKPKSDEEPDAVGKCAKL
jgi:hypothetical protein